MSDEGRGHGDGLRGVGTGIAIGIGTAIIIDQLTRKHKDEPADPDRKPRRASSKSAKARKVAKKPDPKDTPQDDAKPSPPVAQGGTGDGTPSGPKAAPAPATGASTSDAKLTACCSCIESLRLKLDKNGPRNVPDKLISILNPEDPTERINGVQHPKFQPGHNFFVLITARTVKSANQSYMTLNWEEKANRLPTRSAALGIPVDQYADLVPAFFETDLKVKNPKGGHDLVNFKDVAKADGTLSGWWKHASVDAPEPKACPNTYKFQLDDFPSAMTPRRLDFHIRVTSSPDCPCNHAALELYATQMLEKAPPPKNPPPDYVAIEDAVQSASKFYGPDGEMRVGQFIEGVPPQAPQAKLQPQH